MSKDRLLGVCKSNRGVKDGHIYGCYGENDRLCVITMYKHVVYDVQFIIGPNVYSGISFLWKSHVYKL